MANDNRSNLQRWLDCIKSCESSFMCGTDKEAENAASLIEAISPYSDDWMVRYTNWHNSLSNLTH